MTSEALPQIWHLCPTEPTTRIPAPPSTELFIGAIVRTKLLRDLRAPLNRFERPNIPSSWIKEAGPYETSHKVKETRDGSLGFFSTIAQLVNFGPQTSVNWAEDTDVVYNFEEERDIWLDVPPEERRTDVDDSASVSISLCEDAVTASATVQKFRDDSGCHKPVYMVTGIKWVSGISISLGTGHKIGGEAGFKADLTAVNRCPSYDRYTGCWVKRITESAFCKGRCTFHLLREVDKDQLEQDRTSDNGGHAEGRLHEYW
jgi:hypothetical protein